MKALGRVLLIAPCLALALASCATVSEKPSALSRSALESLLAPHREKAAALAAQGNLRDALNEWKIALTIDPKDPVSVEEKNKLDARIQRALDDELAQGRDALKRNVHPEARRHFLAALALDPSNKAAFDALQNEVREIRVLNHTVLKGETLASIAELYYSDRSRLEVIWETNQLPANPKLVPGMVLKIPEIPGVPFVRGGPPRVSPQVQLPSDSTKGEVQEPEEVPLLAEAREALERGEFSVALANVDRFLTQNPRSADGIDLKKGVLYQQGKVLFDQKKYAESYAALTQLVKLAPNYQDTTAMLGHARTIVVQQHYNEGIRLYREEKLEAAIAEWRIVLQYDPNHEGAKKNIDQASRLLKGLQERQQKKPS